MGVKTMANFKDYLEYVKHPILNVGSGRDTFGDVRLDIVPYPEVNCVVDLNKRKIPYPDNYFKTTICISTMEHIKNFWFAFNELCRVTRGLLYIEVPQNSDLRKDMVRILFPTPKNIKLALSTRERSLEYIWQVNPNLLVDFMRVRGFIAGYRPMLRIYHNYLSRYYEVVGRKYMRGK